MTMKKVENPSILKRWFKASKEYQEKQFDAPSRVIDVNNRENFQPAKELIKVISYNDKSTEYFTENRCG